jgi:hypothetical protein
MDSMAAASNRLSNSNSTGHYDTSRFFADQTFHLHALRVLSDVPFGGADISESLETINKIREGDASSWYDAWASTAERISGTAPLA